MGFLFRTGVSTGTGSGGGGGGTAQLAVLGGNTVTTLYANTTARTTTAGATAWGRSIDSSLGIAITEAHDNYSLSYYQRWTAAGVDHHITRTIPCSAFRRLGNNTSTSNTDRSIPSGGCIEFAGSRYRSGDTGFVTSARAHYISRQRHADGHDILRFMMADSGSSDTAAFSNMFIIITLIPNVANLTISGDTAGGGSGLTTFLGLPDPSETYENQVVLNLIDRREYVCVNRPEVSTNATGSIIDLTGFYTDSDADLTVYHTLPSATSAIDDKWGYRDTDDTFWFGDTAFTGYAWYQDSPADALRPVLLAAYDDGEDLPNLGESATVIYLGQLQDDAAFRAALHNLTVDVTANFYVYWSEQNAEFRAMSDNYSPPGSTVDHWQWLNVRSEAINPIYRPGADGHLPPVTEELIDMRAILIDNQGRTLYAADDLHQGQSAHATWTQIDAGSSEAGVPSGYRGVFRRTSDVSSPSANDWAVFDGGGFVAFERYGTLLGVTAWYEFRPFHYYLGSYSTAQHAADAVNYYSSSNHQFAFFGGAIQKLSSWTPPTSTTHTRSWKSGTGLIDVGEDTSIDVTAANEWIATDIDVPEGIWGYINFGDIGSDYHGMWFRFLISDLNARTAVTAGSDKANTGADALMFYGNEDEKFYLGRTSAGKLTYTSTDVTVEAGSIRLRSE